MFPECPFAATCRDEVTAMYHATVKKHLKHLPSQEIKIP